MEVGSDLLGAGDVGHRDRVGAVVDARIVVELVKGCDVDQVAVVPVVGGATEVDEGMSVVSVYGLLRSSRSRTGNPSWSGSMNDIQGGASGVVVLAVTELYLDAVSVARFCVEPPVVAV